MAKIQIDGVGTVELDDAFKTLSPEDQQAVIEGIVAQARQPETQRWRAAAQGATFGLYDEAAAAAQHPVAAASAAFGDETGGQPYYTALESERKKLEDYRRAYPLSSAGWELAGAAGPALAAELFTGGGATPAVGAQTAPLFARIAKEAPRLAKIGTGLGAAYGFGSSEGGLQNRALGALTGGAAGAVTAPVAGALTYPIAGMASRVIDAGRRKLGGRGGKAVEAELQRLAEGTGLTIDEIAARVASGEIMAENETLRMATRALMARGGRGEALTRDVMKRRPQQTREAAAADIQKYLADVGDENVLRAVRADEEAARAAERTAYGAFKTEPASEALTTGLADTLRRVPSAAKEVEIALRAETGKAPFFSVAEDGAVTFSRTPTVLEAEQVRRAVANRATSLYRTEGMGGAGEAVSAVEKGFRGLLDVEAPGVAATRATAAANRAQRDAFTAGSQAFNKSADQIEIDMQAMSPEVLSAFRTGFADAIRRKLQGASGTSFMGTLNNPSRKEAMIFKTIFPTENIDDVMQKIGVAAQSQEARSAIISGPSTALTQAAGKELGAGLNMTDLAAPLRGDLLGSIQTGMKIAKSLAPDLSESDRLRILQVLLSEDPAIVRNALRDEGGVAMFTNALNRAIRSARGAAVGATAQPAARASQTLLP